MTNGKRGAPIGNKNASKNRDWSDAIRRALARRSGSVEGGLNALADQFLEAVAQGDLAAFKELGDRVEGKAAQTTILEGSEDNPIVTKEARFVSPTTD